MVTFDRGHLLALALEAEWFGFDAGYRAVINFRNGKSRSISGTMEGYRYVSLSEEDLARVLDALESSGVLDDGLEPARILDGTWYSLRLKSDCGEDVIRWNCGNSEIDSEFVHLVEKLLKLAPDETCLDGSLPVRFKLTCTAGQNDPFPSMYSINLITGRSRARVSGRLVYVTLNGDEIERVNALLRGTRILETSPRFIRCTGGTYYGINLVYDDFTRRESWNDLNEEVDAEELEVFLHELFISRSRR